MTAASSLSQVRLRTRCIALGVVVALGGIAECAAAGAESGAESLRASKGELPLILTVPHDGTVAPAGVPVRVAENPARDVVTRDTGTAPLAERIARRLEERLGKRPYLVIARVERKFLDVNRPEKDALQSAAMLPAYRAYHAQVAAYVAEVRSRFPSGALLIDVHGQSEEPSTVFRGTRAGLTATALVRRHGAAALSGERSLVGLLAAGGYQVHPEVGAASMREHPKFAGGYTVFTYGSQNPTGIDAIQLEFGKTLRADPRLAERVADALAAFMRGHGMLP